ncbi:MAG: DEAD/DEAH box helicase [Parvicellaceae bacterium]
MNHSSRKHFSKNKNKRYSNQNSRRKKSTLDPQLLIKKAVISEVKEYVSKREYSSMPIHQKLKDALAIKGYIKPTEIQDRTLEALLDKRDILGIAQTGTGKTGAFLIPIINQLIENNTNPFALVVVPTRELAVQVQQEFKSMTKGLNLFSACFIGGTNINKDLQILRRNSHLVIGTPGRILDLVNRKALDLRKLNTLILDEFDRMLDMGFVHDVKKIIYGMQNRKHTLLFSATLNDKQNNLIKGILKKPVTVKISNGSSTGDNINQDIIRISDQDDKFGILLEMLKRTNFKKILIFEETKHRVNRLCAKLNKVGIKSDQIQGNKSQNARQKALGKFKKGEIKVLVATDVAARGIDISDITHVINYQVPESFDSYIHRIGRTGRAGRPGQAYTFVD